MSTSIYVYCVYIDIYIYVYIMYDKCPLSLSLCAYVYTIIFQGFVVPRQLIDRSWTMPCITCSFCQMMPLDCWLLRLLLRPSCWSQEANGWKVLTVLISVLNSQIGQMKLPSFFLIRMMKVYDHLRPFHWLMQYLYGCSLSRHYQRTWRWPLCCEWNVHATSSSRYDYNRLHTLENLVMNCL